MDFVDLAIQGSKKDVDKTLKGLKPHGEYPAKRINNSLLAIANPIIRQF